MSANLLNRPSESHPKPTALLAIECGSQPTSGIKEAYRNANRQKDVLIHLKFKVWLVPGQPSLVWVLVVWPQQVLGT